MLSLAIHNGSPAAFRSGLHRASRVRGSHQVPICRSTHNLWQLTAHQLRLASLTLCFGDFFQARQLQPLLCCGGRGIEQGGCICRAPFDGAALDAAAWSCTMYSAA